MWLGFLYFIIIMSMQLWLNLYLLAWVLFKLVLPKLESWCVCALGFKFKPTTWDPISSVGNEEVMTCHAKLVDEILTSILSILSFEIKPCSNRGDFSCTLWLNLDRPESHEGMGSTLIVSLHLWFSDCHEQHKIRQQLLFNEFCFSSSPYLNKLSYSVTSGTLLNPGPTFRLCNSTLMVVNGLWTSVTLPIRDASFDVCFGGFVISHLSTR